MGIDYEDIKSEYLSVGENRSVEFSIVKDAVKVMRTSQKSGNTYPSYEFEVKSGNDKLKWSGLRKTYRQMTLDAGEPETLVGTRWKWVHTFADGKHDYVVQFLGASSELAPSGDLGVSSPAPSGGDVPGVRHDGVVK